MPSLDQNIRTMELQATELAEKGYFEESLDIVQDLLEFDEENDKFHRHAGYDYLELGNQEKGLLHFLRAFELNPNTKNAENLLSKYTEDEKLEEATKINEYLLRIQPLNAKYHNSKAALLFTAKDFQRGFEEIQFALNLDDKDANIHFNLAMALIETGRYDEGKKEYQVATNIEPCNEYFHDKFGQKAFETEHYADAIDALNKIVALKKDDSDTHQNIGNSLHKLGVVNEAVVEFKKSLQLNPSNTETHKDLAATYFKMHEYSLAILHLRKAMKVITPDEEVLSILAGCYSAIRNTKAYKKTLEQIIAINPLSIDANEQLAYIYHNSNAHKEALERLDVLVQIEPQNPQHRQNKASTLIEIKQYQQALDFIEETLRSGIKTSSLFLQRGKCFYNLTRNEEALEALKDSLELDDSNSEAFAYMGLILSAKGMKQEARKYFEKTLVSEQNPLVLLNIAEVCCDSELYEEATQFAEKALPSLPENADVNHVLSKSYFELQEYEKALPFYKRIIELEPDIHINEFNYGHTLSKLERHSEGIPHMLKALRKEPHNPIFLSSLGASYINTEQYEKGLKFLSEAVIIEPEHYDSRIMTAHAFIIAGKPDESKPHIDKALQIEPENGIGYTMLANYQIRKKFYFQALASLITSISKTKHIDTQDSALTYKLFGETFEAIGNASEIIANLEKEFARTQDYSDIGDVLVTLLDYVGDSDKEKGVAQKAISLMRKNVEFSDGEGNVRNNIISVFSRNKRNDVAVLLTNPLSENNYVLKISSSRNVFSRNTSLDDEFVTQSFVYNILRGIEQKISRGPVNSRFIKTPAPLCFFEENGRKYMIMRKVNDMNLEQLYFALQDNPDMPPERKRDIMTSAIKNALETMSRIAVYGENAVGESGIIRVPGTDHTTQVSPLDMQANFDRRFIGRVDGKDGRKLLAEHQALFKNGMRYFLHGDLYPSNALENGFVLDFEKRALGDPSIDISNLLAFPGFDGLDREELFEHYLSRFASHHTGAGLRMSQGIDDRLRANFHLNMIHNSLCLASYLSEQGNSSLAQAYFQNALQHMNDGRTARFKDAVVGYVGMSSREDLKSVL